MLAALWFGTPRLGLVGVITLVVCFNFVERVIALAKAARIVGVRARDLVLLKDVGKLAGAATIAGVSAWIVRALLAGQRPFVVLVACGSIFTCVYALAILALRIVTPDERASLTSRLARLPHVGRFARRAAQPVV
jgi:hypothetical protein